jgi:predicted glycosyltransferase
VESHTLEDIFRIMRICLYNSSFSKARGPFDKIIWCPLSGDIVYIVHLFRKSLRGSALLHLESVFRDHLNREQVEGITFFDTETIIRENKERLVAFYSQSDTLANSTLCLISEDPHYKYINYIPSGNAENADLFFEKNNIPCHKYSYRHFREQRPDLLVLYNDWTKAAIRVISHCHLLGIPVVCIQESIINFGDRFRRMQRADDVMIQGVRSAMMIPRKHFYLTGNPRYFRPVSREKHPEYVLINCNFTYNIFDNIRRAWLDDITSSLDEMGVDYLISRHPRDNGDLRKYKNVVRSSSSGLDEQFAGAGLLITRFSSLIHESLVRGIPVIYYNPHNEKIIYDFDFDPEFLATTGDRAVLKEYIYSLYRKNISGKDLDSYLNVHCLPAETEPVSNINQLLAGNSFSDTKFTFKDLMHLIFYRPFILSAAMKIRRMLSKSPESED